MAAAATLPSINGAACVHALAPHASCHACVSACPQGAWLLDEDGLALDTSRCDGCGLCIPACPRAALSLSRPLTILRDHAGNGTAFAACDRAPHAGIAAMPCLHALGRRDLDHLADDAVQGLIVLSGPCESCARGKTASNLPAAARLHASLRSSHDLPTVRIEAHDATTFGRRLRRAKEDSETVNGARRRLLAPFLPHPVPTEVYSAEAPLVAIAPRISPERCVACDACAGICPDGALILRAGATPAYVVTPPACSGCGLCVDVCDQQAITLHSPAHAAKSTLELDPCRCAACGAAYHTVAGFPRNGGGLCRICARTQHHRKLFQVFKPT